MNDERSFTLRQIDQLLTYIANLEIGQEFLMQQINRLPAASDVWRVATLVALVATVLGIAGIEAFWRYFPCAPAWR